MIGINITATGIETTQDNLNILHGTFKDKMPVFFNKFVDDGMIPGVKKAFQKRGYGNERWPAGFQPDKEMEALLTKRQNYKIVTRKDSVRVTPKKIIAVDQKDLRSATKRGSEMSNRKRGGNELAVMKDGVLKITKTRGSGKQVNVITLDKKEIGKITGNIFRKWLKTIKFKK